MPTLHATAALRQIRKITDTNLYYVVGSRLTCFTNLYIAALLDDNVYVAVVWRRENSSVDTHNLLLLLFHSLTEKS